MVHSSLEQHVEQLEAKEREELQRSQPAAPARKPSHVRNSVTPLDQRPVVEIPTAKAIDRLAGIFDEHATKILAVANDPSQVVLRQQEAFAAIRRMAPLTYVNETKIIERLEAVIAEKVSLETPDEPAPQEHQPALRPPPAPAPAPTVAPEAFAAMLAPFVKMLDKSDDPLSGRQINPSRVRTRGVIQDDNEETPE